MISADIVGSVAATLTTLAFFPQAIKVILTKETAGISLPMYAMFSSGVSLWLIYGIMITSWPIIIANVITLILALIILTQLIKNRAQK